MFAYRRTALRRRVLVALRSDKAIRGTLIAKRGPLLVLANAVLLEPGHELPMDGQVVIERSNVEWIQVLAAVEVQ